MNVFAYNFQRRAAQGAFLALFLLTPALGAEESRSDSIKKTNPARKKIERPKANQPEHGKKAGPSSQARKNKAPEKPPRTNKKLNIVFFIMESVGQQYIFDTDRGNALPMPFLKKIAQQSLYFTNHFSPANTTPRSSFSIMSGVYPAPIKKMFVERKDVRIPSLKQHLSREYDFFYFYNSPQSWFFPRWFYKNNRVPVYSMDNVKRRNWGPGPRLGRNEEQFFRVFQYVLKKKKEPFVAVYHSFAAHYPYFNFNPRYNVYRDKRLKRPRGRRRLSIFERGYYNNLRLLDELLKKLFAQLKKAGVLKNTIVVITGDHGEAFGTPVGNWTHSRASFNVNYRVPLIIYHPGLFKPRQINRRTLHIDILPTLLSVLNVKYDRGLIQGESLLNGKSKRLYDFLYGNEKTLTAINRKNVKLQYNQGRCWVYYLDRDPGERRKRSCRPHRDQLRALRAYSRYQTRFLFGYNRALKKKRRYLPGAPPWLQIKHSVKRVAGKEGREKKKRPLLPGRNTKTNIKKSCSDRAC